MIMEKKTYHHGNLKAALIEAGIELMNEAGEEGLSLRKIAKRCGVSSAAPYAHFDGKTELIAAMQEYVTEKFMRYLKQAIEQCEHPGTHEEIFCMGKAYVLVFLENPQYYKFLYFHNYMKVDFSIDSKDNYPPFQLLKDTVLRLHEREGIHLAKQDQELELLKLWSDVHGLASIASMNHHNIIWNQAWDETIENILCYHDKSGE